MTAQILQAAPPGQHDTRAKAWGFTGLLVLLYIINWGDKAIFGVVAQPIAEEFGLSASQIGLIGSAFFLTFTLGGLLAGLINKWLPLRWSLVLLAVGWAASMIPTVVVAGFAVLLISRMILGLFEGPSAALILSGVYTWHPPEKRSFPSACINAAGGIAQFAVAPLLALVAAAWGWRAAFISLAAVGIAWCVIWLLTWKEGPFGAQEPIRRDDLDAASASTVAHRVPWTTIFFTPTFIGGAVGAFAMYALITVVLTWLPSYFEVGLGYSRVQAGVMFGIPSIAGIVIILFATAIADRLLVRGVSSRIVRGIVPGIGLLLCGLALVTLPYIGVPIVAVAVVSFGYGIGGIVFPLFSSGLSEICPPGQIAGALGVFLALQTSAGLVAPYLTGVIVDSSESPAAGYAFAFQVCGILALVGAVVALVFVNPVRDAQRVLANQA
ncbi:MFS transporter [Dietzia sp. KRD202]|uniref:MFS transporter n=1 Tax=Dietzia sp. KRD202 TaxID=2729732 RepID=UPI0019D02FEA|nr:MFS transporter [Dietzia sp. KRD202]